MNNDLISRSELKKALKSNCKPELCHDYNTAWCESCCPHNDFEDLIDYAPTVEERPQEEAECMEEDAKQASIPYTYNAPQHDWKCGYPDSTRGKKD